MQEKEIVVVFQDCILCGDHGEKKAEVFAKKGLKLRKISFVTEEGRKLCNEAVAKGIGCMPFFKYNGKIYESLDEIEAKMAKKSKKAAKELTSHGND